jgi:hypothetical protein
MLRVVCVCVCCIQDLCPIAHADSTFIPALFVAAKGDDFIRPHHSQQLHDAYAGDKNIVRITVTFAGLTVTVTVTTVRTASAVVVRLLQVLRMVSLILLNHTPNIECGGITLPCICNTHLKLLNV